MILGLTGTVENLDNGDVLIIATGDPKVLEDFVRWCHKGPQLASVTSVNLVEIALRHFPGFSIKR